MRCWLNATMCAGLLTTSLFVAGNSCIGASQDRAVGDTIPVTGDRLSGFVLPVEPIVTELGLAALKAYTWTIDDTKRLVLVGDATITIGHHHFRSDVAVIWLNRLPTAEGLVNQIAIYFPDLRDAAREAGLGTRGRVLVTASTRGEVTLDLAALIDSPPPPQHQGAVRRGERRLAEHLKALLDHPPPLASQPRAEAVADAGLTGPLRPGAPVVVPPPAESGEVVLARTPRRTLPLFEADGTLRFSAGRSTMTPGPDENVITSTGGIVVAYSAIGADDEWTDLRLSASRAVIFTDPGSPGVGAAGEFQIDAVRGIYLEGNVIANANQGEYVVRAPRMYYDVESNRAIMLDAVLRTYARDDRTPIYARAKEMRQIAANQWTGIGARVSTSEFRKPHLALGAGRVTITQRPGTEPGERETVHIDSVNNTLRIDGFPVFYWPRFSGTTNDLPLKSITLGSRSQDGLFVKTKWNPWGLLGIERPAGFEGNLLVDGFTDRGPAIGFTLAYDLPGMEGSLDFYGVHDEGIDRTSSGFQRVPDDPWRGVALWEHQVDFDEHWSLQAQLAAISDETFITAWREGSFASRREYETTLLLRHVDHNAAFTFLGKYAINDFISNDWLLASRAYQVEKLPEAAYRRYGDAPFDVFTYSGDTRLSRVRIVPQQGTPADIGVPGGAFGIGQNDSIADSLGLSGQSVTRFDTRHEVAAPMSWGPIRVVPYVSGRITAYDDNLEPLNSDSNTTRLFGAVGMRLQTRLQHVDESAESRLLGIHRLRHIIEPRVHAWYGYSDVPDGALPIYDQDVEGLSTGSVVEVGLRNVFQTQRGGPGRWRSVDFLTVDLSASFNWDEQLATPIPRFYDFRPELSSLGDHVAASAVWLPSDQLSFSTQGTFDLDKGHVAIGSVGSELLHNPRFSTFAEYRFIDLDDTQLLDLGWNYWLTVKYRFTITPQWDFQEDDFRAVSLHVLRRFPDFDLTIRVRRDEIADQTTFGASIDLTEF